MNSHRYRWRLLEHGAGADKPPRAFWAEHRQQWRPAPNCLLRRYLQSERSPAESRNSVPGHPQWRSDQHVIQLCELCHYGKLSSLADYILTWASRDAASRAYAESHLKRLEKILAITPLGTKADRVLEMGVYFHITAALKTQLGYGEVRGCYYGRRGVTEHKSVASVSGEVFECDVDLFDAERDPFPYPNGHFSAVLCCELLEHLACDPMHMISEINRILKSGGHLVLTTPNIGSLRAISAILKGYNPGFFPAYIRPSNEGEVEARHSREYTAHEIYSLITDGGFTVTYCDTGPFCEENENDLHWVTKLLTEHNLKSELRGNCTFAVGKKSGPLRQRYPSWLYSV